MERNSRFLIKEYHRALVPVMISVLGGTINAIIDSAFVTRRLDSGALAAITYSMPVFLVLCLCGCLFGVGASILSARSLGEHDKEKATGYYHSMITLSLITGILFIAFGILGTDIITTILCADPNLYSAVKEYVTITLRGAPFYILIYVPNYYLQLDGKGKNLSVMMLIMIISDIVLDYVFLYVADLGIGGAATASVLSVALSVIYGFICLQDKNGMFRIDIRKLKVHDVGEICKFGSVSALGSLLDVARLFFLNRIIFSSSGMSGMEVWAVLNALSELSLCILTGIPRTAIPLLGIYHTGHDNEGLRLVMKIELKTGLFLISVYSVLLVVFSHPIRIFYKMDNAFLFPLICLGLSVVFELICSILGSFYNVTKRILLANILMSLRILVCPVLTAWLLMRAGLDIFLFLPIGMGLVVISIPLLSYIRSKFKHEEGHELSKLLLLDDFMEKNGRVKTFSIVASDENICSASEGITEFCTEHNMDHKLAMKLGLSLEEVMTVVAKRSLLKSDDPVEVRVYAYNGVFGIGIMCFGKKFDPFVISDDEDEMFMGIRMIEKISKNRKYIYTLGMNILSVEF